jgi:hypothetical protein
MSNVETQLNLLTRQTVGAAPSVAPVVVPTVPTTPEAPAAPKTNLDEEILPL